MDTCIVSKTEEGLNSIEKSNKNNLKNIKSDFFVKKMFLTLSKKKLLNIIKYNKQTQNLLDINIFDYKKYNELYTPIEIEIIPFKDACGKFIHIFDDESFFHIYFNDCKEETKRNYITENDKIEKIKIILDYRVNSFGQIFAECICIQSIYFRKCYRKNINNMDKMFYNCSLLKEIDLTNFNTENVINMSSMFYGCASLKEINLSNFNTNKVTSMEGMFFGCVLLKEIELTNFNTNNVLYFGTMFYGCSSLQKINLSNFRTNNAVNMSLMFMDVHH